MTDRPLGPILTIVNSEAIVRPHQSFIAKGAKVSTLENKIIGQLDNPIGPVSHPYQVIKLYKPIPNDLLGQLVIAKLSEKKKTKRNKKKQKK